MKIFKTILFIAALLSFSFAIRIWRVTEAPGSVNWDEAAVGYNAYSILKTGRDEFGKAIPISLRSFDDYKPALYSWLSTVPIAFFGLGELTTRLTSVIAGTILVFSVLYITAKLSGDMGLGIVAGIFTAVSPWAIHFSRIAFEANLAVSLFFLAIAAWLKKPTLGLFFFVLSMYAYHSQRAIAVPAFLLLMWLFRIKLQIRHLILTGIMLLPLVYSFLTEPAGSRLTTTIILRLWPFVPEDFSKLIFSPIYTMAWQMSGQFMAYFSPVTLFVRGSNEPILRIPTLGLLPIELLPLWLAGMVKIFKKNNLNRMLWAILLLAPLPAVITWNWFSVVRTLAVYPAMAIIAALGFKYLRLPNLLKTGYWGIIGLSTLYTILTIAIYAPYETYGDFQPGFEKVVPYTLSESDKYNEVIVDTGQATPYIFFLFYGKYPPEKYHQEARRDLGHTLSHGYKFGKFNFRKIEDYELYKKDLLLVGQTNKLPEYEIETVQRSRDIKYKDFYDIRGYVNLRVVNL